MSELILVRHGQANSHASDEAGYDRLSDLGRQQASWLGEYFRASQERFDHVVTGTLKRQIDTARHMDFTSAQEDARLDELRYFELTKAVERRFGFPVPDTVADYAKYLPQVIGHWSRDEIDDAPENWSDFCQRTADVVDELVHRGGRTLVVTSGGVISMMVRHVLRLDPDATARIMLHVRNTSVHSVRFVHDTLMLGGFNATPHLDAPERAFARTFI